MSSIRALRAYAVENQYILQDQYAFQFVHVRAAHHWQHVHLRRIHSPQRHKNFAILFLAGLMCGSIALCDLNLIGI